MRGCGRVRATTSISSRDRAAGRGDDQFRDAGAGHLRDAGIGSALVAVRGVGVHAEAASGVADRGGIEPRGLDEYVAGGVGDHRGLAAHDSGQRYGFDGVGDDEVGGRELALDAVESYERLAGAGAAHDDLAALEFVEVEGVGGLADFVEHVVGGVGHVVDAALLDEFDAMRDVRWRRRDLDSAHDAGGVTRAAFERRR